MTRTADEPRIYVIDLDELGRIRPGGQLIRVESVEGLVYLIACSDARMPDFSILMVGPTSDELIEWTQQQSAPTYCVGRPDGVINGAWISGEPEGRVELGGGAWLVCLGPDGVPRELEEFVRWMGEANADQILLERLIARFGTSFLQAHLKPVAMERDYSVRTRDDGWLVGADPTAPAPEPPRDRPGLRATRAPDVKPFSSLELPAPEGGTGTPQRRGGIRGVRLGAALIEEAPAAPRTPDPEPRLQGRGGLDVGTYDEGTFDAGVFDEGAFAAGEADPEMLEAGGLDADTLDVGPIAPPRLNTAKLNLSPLGTDLEQSPVGEAPKAPPPEEPVRPMAPPPTSSGGGGLGRALVGLVLLGAVGGSLWVLREPLMDLLPSEDSVDPGPVTDADDPEEPEIVADGPPVVNSCAVLAGVEKVESGAFCWRLIKVVAEGEPLSDHLREELESFHAVRDELELEMGASMEAYTQGQPPTAEQKRRVHEAWEPVVSALHGRLILEIFLDDWESKATSAKDPYRAQTTPLGARPSDWLNGFSPRVAVDEEWVQVFHEGADRPVNVTKLRDELFPGSTSGLRSQERLSGAARSALGQSE